MDYQPQCQSFNSVLHILRGKKKKKQKYSSQDEHNSIDIKLIISILRLKKIDSLFLYIVKMKNKKQKSHTYS